MDRTQKRKKSDENVYGRQAVAYQSGGALAVCQRRPSLPFLRLIKLKSNEEKFLRKKKIRKRLTDGGIVKGSGQGKNMSRPKWIVKKHCGGVGNRIDQSAALLTTVNVFRRLNADNTQRCSPTAHITR